MTTHPQTSWWRSCLPVAASWPYFLPAWIVFAYFVLAPPNWPHQYVSLLYALAGLFAQVSRFTMRVTLRQWFVAVGLLPALLAVLFLQAYRLFIHAA